MSLKFPDGCNADILIVDDTPDNIRFLSTRLSEEGYRVRKAINGAMAITAAKMVPPDLILLDINMPEMNGYEVCDVLKQDEKTSSIPIIFLSVLDDIENKVKAFIYGGVDYITKPFHLTEVLVRVHHQLSLQAAKREILQLNAQLEERVRERTRALKIANAGLQQEIFQRQQAQARLLEMALHDSLTGLPNRTLFMESLEKAFEKANIDASQQFAVLFLDCDRFKVVNNSLGHFVGDELLVAIAQRLQSLKRTGDVLARLGGDEFAILFHEIDTAEQVQGFANEILKQSFSTPFRLQGRELFINASAGLALWKSDYQKPNHLLRDADTAMYRAKESGKQQVCLFQPTMHVSALYWMQTENDLRKAIERNELLLNYQPIISLQTGHIISFESLIRWQHPKRGLVSPEKFIPIAEETNLIVPIGEWVLQEACRQLAHWHNQKLANNTLKISVNLSTRQFAQANLLGCIDGALEYANLNPCSLKLEITESAIMDNALSAKQTLQKLRERQITLCIDDFGTGYSSLSYLHSFPVDILKIDRAFINHVDAHSENLGLVPAIINMSRSMGIDTIAEGIETREQLARLRTLQCFGGQGYLFSKPLSPEEATQLLAKHPVW